MADNKNVTPSTDNKALANVNKGEITMADQVVAKIAGLAMSEVEGVYAVGGGLSRAFGAAREALGGSKNITQGVAVEVGKRQAAIDLTLIVEYPKPVHDVAQKVRESVLRNVEKLTGLEVVEVNIDITDVHVPGEEKDEDEEAKAAAARKRERESKEPRVQ